MVGRLIKRHLHDGVELDYPAAARRVAEFDMWALV